MMPDGPSEFRCPHCGVTVIWDIYYEASDTVRVVGHGIGTTKPGIRRDLSDQCPGSEMPVSSIPTCFQIQLV